MKYDWYKELAAAVTVCDTKGVILYMNDKSIETFEKDGGKDLIGKNLFDCHPGESAIKLEKLLESRKENIYSIEKNGIKKMIIQAPWFEKSEYKGFIEFSFILPVNIPHYIRK
ncbi:MAG: PAS domain-containing protein [Ignavibacteria bacterium]